MNLEKKNSFRNDINGLRAISVIAVTLYHFNEHWLPGGFAGVDVFFVISGYLMTKIIFSRVNEDRFSLIEFYYDRARRIVPALIVLCLALSIFGWLVLTPTELAGLGYHVAGSLLFLSNIQYWLEAGYFDLSSHGKWLLHTWSLSVEWQFYLIYPVLIAFLKNRTLIQKQVIISILALFSFVACAYLSVSQSEANFFLFFTRAWEMLLGGLVVLYDFRVKHKYSRGMEILGVSLIGISFFFMSKSNLWPGLLTLFPVIGTVIVLVVNRNDSKITSNFLFRPIGLASYSIYLWHWPLVVLLYRQNVNGSVPWILAGISASLVLGFISYYVVERNGLYLSAIHKYRPVFARVALFMMFSVVVSFGVAAKVLDGFPARFVGVGSKEIAKIQNVWLYFLKDSDWRIDLCHAHSRPISLDDAMKNCVDRGQGKLLFLWGDSFAAALYPGLRDFQASSKEHFLIAQFTEGNAQPYFDKEGFTSTKRSLLEANSIKLEAVRQLKPAVVLIAWSSGYAGGSTDDREKIINSLRITVDRIRGASPDSRVVIIGPPPLWRDNLVNLILRYRQEKQEDPSLYTDYGLVKEMFEWDKILEVELRAQNIEYVGIIHEFCNEDSCITSVGKNVSDLATIDGGHLTPSAARYLFNRIGPSLLGAPALFHGAQK